MTLTECGLKPYRRATEAIVRLYRENSGYRENEVKHWVHVHGLCQILSVKVSHRTSVDLDLVEIVYGGVPLRAR